MLRRGYATDTTIPDRRILLWSFARHIAPTPVLEATGDQVAEWARPDLAPRTRRHYISTLHSFYTWAIRARRTDWDPTVEVPMPRVPRTVPRPNSDDDLTMALQLADDRMRCWLLLGRLQGLRCKEIAGLRGEHVLWRSEPPLLLIANGKGGHEGLVPLNEHVEAALKRYGLPARGWLFPRSDDRARPLKAKTVQLYINRFLHDLGIADTAHQFRHGLGTDLWRRTHDLRLVQEVLRHADPATTAGYSAYDHGEAVAAVRWLRIVGSDQQRLDL